MKRQVLTSTTSASLPSSPARSQPPASSRAGSSSESTSFLAHPSVTSRTVCLVAEGAPGGDTARGRAAPADDPPPDYGKPLSAAAAGGQVPGQCTWLVHPPGMQVDPHHADRPTRHRILAVHAHLQSGRSEGARERQESGAASVGQHGADQPACRAGALARCTVQAPGLRRLPQTVAYRSLAVGHLQAPLGHAPYRRPARLQRRGTRYGWGHSEARGTQPILKSSPPPPRPEAGTRP